MNSEELQNMMLTYEDWLTRTTKLLELRFVTFDDGASGRYEDANGTPLGIDAMEAIHNVIVRDWETFRLRFQVVFSKRIPAERKSNLIDLLNLLEQLIHKEEHQFLWEEKASVAQAMVKLTQTWFEEEIEVLPDSMEFPPIDTQN